MTLKHHAAGSAFPEFSENKLRLYSMHYCPYAERSRLVLAAKKIPYEVVNVNLREKPDWFLARTPVGAVPVLEHADGRVLYESLIVCEYLDTLYPEYRLTSSDPFVKAQHQILIEMFSRVIGPFYKLLRTKEASAGDELNQGLAYFEKSLNNNFFGGENEAMVDYMIWPWFERLPVFKEFSNFEFDSARFPKLAEWITRMESLPAVKEVKIQPESFSRFFKGYLESNADYDFELN